MVLVLPLRDDRVDPNVKGSAAPYQYVLRQSHEAESTVLEKTKGSREAFAAATCTSFCTRQLPPEFHADCDKRNSDPRRELCIPILARHDLNTLLYSRCVAS